MWFWDERIGLFNISFIYQKSEWFFADTYQGGGEFAKFVSLHGDKQHNYIICRYTTYLQKKIRGVSTNYNHRANGASRRSGRKPGARVTNSARLFTPKAQRKYLQRFILVSNLWFGRKASSKEHVIRHVTACKLRMCWYLLRTWRRRNRERWPEKTI